MKNLAEHPEYKAFEELSKKFRSGEINSNQFDAGMVIFKKLTAIHRLKVKALELALKKDQPEIARIIQEDVLQGWLDPEEILEPHSFFPLATAEHPDLWKPFFEKHSEAQVQEWFQNSKLAKIELNTKIKQLREQLKRLKGDVEG